MIVGDGAELDLVSLQLWDDDAVHLGQIGGRVGRDACVRHVPGQPRWRRSCASTRTVEYDGPGGEAERSASTSSTPASTSSTGSSSTTTQPHTKSNVDYKGGLQGEGAHAVWVGDVLIRKVAEGIETYETNRNLVLTDGCRADSVPNLEIETGEIDGAGHASATGRFDDEQLFYLQSRGITEDEARRLVVHGFFADIIRKIGVAAVEAQLLAAVEAELAQYVGARLPRR